jgi:hypothetical protein
MTSARWWRFAVVGLVALGCGSSGDNGTPAYCADKMIALMGDLDGQPVDLAVNYTSLAFQQLSMPYTFDVGYADGMLHLEWNTRFPENEGGASATGTLVMPAGAPHAGETIWGGGGTIRQTTTTDGTGSRHSNYIFTLGTLSAGPTCPGTAVAGTVSACVSD